MSPRQPPPTSPSCLGFCHPLLRFLSARTDFVSYFALPARRLVENPMTMFGTARCMGNHTLPMSKPWAFLSLRSGCALERCHPEGNSTYHTPFPQLSWASCWPSPRPDINCMHRRAPLRLLALPRCRWSSVADGLRRPHVRADYRRRPQSMVAAFGDALPSLGGVWPSAACTAAGLELEATPDSSHPDVK